MTPDCAIIVAGSLTVEPSKRDAYLAGSAEIVEQARAAEGCLDFSISADLIEPGRVNILELWDSKQALEKFRGAGPEGDQATVIHSGSVFEYDISNRRRLM